MKATGKQLRPKEFARHLAQKLDGPNDGLAIKSFTADTGQLKKDVTRDIRLMETNKSIGTDGSHVEMLKENPETAACLLTKLW